MGYWAICFPPSVNRFFISKPWTVMKQYDAINRNIEKNIIIELNNININVIIFIGLNSIFNFVIDIISIISAWIILDVFIKSKSDDKVWSNIFFGLSNSLSNEPFMINFSKVSMPLAKVSVTEKPNWIIEKHNSISYLV